MISITQAVNNAQIKLSELIPQANNVLLEEVELIKTDFHITLSFPDSGVSIIHSGFVNPRKYKLIIIDANNGSFKSMKIRNV